MASVCRASQEEGGRCSGALSSRCGAQALECLQLLAQSRAGTAKAPGDGAAAAAKPDADRQVRGDVRVALLAEKRELGSSMEELRATMRSVQEQCERCAVETRKITALEASARALTIATHDELTKLHEQIRRATQQAADHFEARERLGQELAESAEAFQGIIAQEVDAHVAMQHEVLQLQQVVRDLEGRLRSKSAEIDRLVRGNVKAAEEVTVARAAARQGRGDGSAAADDKEGLLEKCTDFLEGLTKRQPMAPKREPKEPMGTAGGAGASAGGAAPGLAALHSTLSRREEHLAALRRKVEFLSARAPPTYN